MVGRIKLVEDCEYFTVPKNYKPELTIKMEDIIKNFLILKFFLK